MSNSLNNEKTIATLLENTEDFELIGLPSQSVTSVAYNSKKVIKGTCFVAIKGEKFDGHDFIADAVWNGASVVVCEKLPERNLITPETAFVLTKNSRKCLAEISNAFYDYPSRKLKIIGITGTNGKTTCTYLMKSIIESDNKTCGIIGTTGIFSGSRKIEATHTTPESLELAEILSLMVDDGIEYVVMEVSSHSLVQHRVDCIDFEAALFTNLTHDHLDFHKTMENYADSKKILFDKLSKNNFAVINTDSDWAEYMVGSTKSRKIIRVGRKIGNDFRIMREKSDLKGVEFILFSGVKLIDVITKLAGQFNIDNAALCAAACQSLGISKQAIQHGLSVTGGAPGRMQRINLENGTIALVDYAHTPDALEKSLKSCRYIIENSSSKSSRIICVFGCGGDRDKTKRPVMGKISGENADITIITSDNPRTEDPMTIIEDIKSGVISSNIIEIIPDRSEAIKHAVKISRANDLILVAGKGHENYQITGTEKIHFDDSEELSKYS
ncbi:MAG: UDP-N-acetylmuramoyl-L-alanyl-D-glutamate--2,6-diaminopimelate ligase [Candidatus Kapabacteria bacterium]|nr:UDP-N-acetylmuramoyl-L-alanyl-D-glutamate--2,6-diaminopimelate ligase [Candidatus Kapabacteria bacterium]